jgi:hypothetical protein
MSDLTIKAFVDLERGNFENFNNVLASRFEEAWSRALVIAMRIQLKTKDHAEITLPWGTYSADNVAKGEAGNIAPKWEPAKGFLKILNDDISDQSDRAAIINQDEFDPTFMKLFKDFVAYGFFNPEAPENKDRVSKNKGVRLSDDEADFFLNEYALMLCNLAKDKQRDGKIFRLEINNSYPHGCFDFEYDDNDIKVRWTADKIFKQCLKDDEAAAKADVNDFTPIQEGEVRRQDIALD